MKVQPGLKISIQSALESIFLYKFTYDNAKDCNPGKYICQKVKQIKQNWIIPEDSLPNI